MTAHTGYCGMDGHKLLVLRENHTQKEKDEAEWEFALENAATYGMYPLSDQPEDYDEDENDGWSGDQYSEGIEAFGEEYDPDEHDGLGVGSENFEDVIQEEIARFS